MQTIQITPQKGTIENLKILEEKGLIKLMTPSEDILANPYTDKAEDIYASDEQYGPHKLLCVRKNTTNIKLTIHPDNEEVIAINTSQSVYKPLYLIIALCDVSTFEAKAKNNTLSENDITAIEVLYNCEASVFTVLKNIPHCEITTDEEKEAPVFFVTEPHKLQMRYVECGDFDFKV